MQSSQAASWLPRTTAATAVFTQVPLIGPTGCVRSAGISAYGITALSNPSAILDDIVLVGTSCGMAVKQSGASWAVLPAQIEADRTLPAVYSVVAADPDVTDGTARLIAATSRGLRVTNDFGRTWRTVAAGDKLYLGDFPRPLATDPMDRPSSI